MSKLQNEVGVVFRSAFGRTPLKERLDDIRREATELGRFVDVVNLREELGDTLASAIMLAEEMEIDYKKLVRKTLVKIRERHDQYKSLSRKWAVAILGGAFDPPTLGHIDVAKYVLDTSRTFDEVWLLPCFSHSFNKDMASPQNRLAMCNLAVKCDRRIQVCDYEIRNKLSGETYHTVKRLLSDELPYSFSWIIGMDNANDFNTWVNADLLERLIRFVIVPRQGVTRDPKIDWYLQPPHIYLGRAEREIRHTSSTEVRNTVLAGDHEVAQSIVDPGVWRYIQKKKLYWRK